MNPEIGREWVRRLRSGDYQQGIGRLRQRDGDIDRYCCLGVLCDVFDPNQWSPDGRSYRYQGLRRGLPPNEVLLLAGIDPCEELKLTEMNDDKRLTFVEIADYIEKELLCQTVPQ